MNNCKENWELLSYSDNEISFARLGDVKEYKLQEKSQKDLIQFLVKINGKSIRQAALHLNKKQQNLFKTLERENLSFDNFLRIYEFSTSEGFKTHFEAIDQLKGLRLLKLRDVVNLCNAEGFPFVVKCGRLYYKMINK